MMREVVEVVHAKNELFLPLLNLVTTFIDGLAGGKRGAVEKDYVKYLELHFPALVAELPAKTFYRQYRCGAVHDFSPKPGYAIGRDHGMAEAYAATQRYPELGGSFTVLNIDRLVTDFLKHVRGLELALAESDGSAKADRNADSRTGG